MKIRRNIDTVSSISAKDFEELYLKPQKPVIIKGLAKLFPAGQKWTIDYLRDYCGDVTIDLFDNSLKNHNASAFTKPDLRMPFRNYVDILVRDESSTLRVFLFNMFKKKPGLRKHFPCPHFFRGVLGKMGYMFFGAKDTKVRAHQDIDMSNVLLTQFEGRKRVLLVAPEYSDLLYRLPFNTYTLVDPDNPDYEKYPGLKYVEATECILEPGDALFMPSGYWHYITYLDWGYAVSYRKMALSFKLKLAGLKYLAILMPLDKLMNFCLGHKWLTIKQHIAQRKAEKIISQKIISEAKANYLKYHEKRQIATY